MMAETDEHGDGRPHGDRRPDADQHTVKRSYSPASGGPSYGSAMILVQLTRPRFDMHKLVSCTYCPPWGKQSGGGTVSAGVKPDITGSRQRQALRKN